jgi:hypothetical protein
MDDHARDTQWRSAQHYCKKQIKDFDRKLKLTHSDLSIQGYLVDAVPVENIQELCKSYKHVYALSEQSGFKVPKNCTVYTIPKSFYGTYYVDNLNQDCKIVRDYNCFMHRSDIARQNWFYIFYERDWLDRGWVSFNMHLKPGLYYPANTSKDVFDYYHQRFLNSYDYLYSSVEKIVPYKNFVDTHNQFERVLETKFSIVLEPYYERPDSVCFSEKTMRVLQLPRPWVLFGATGSVDRLRNMGFDVFDDFVDHSYDAFDTEQSYVQRQDAMIPEIEKLLQLQATPAIVDIWKQKAQHNRNILKTWSQSWQSEFLALLDKVYCDAIHTNGK